MVVQEVPFPCSREVDEQLAGGMHQPVPQADGDSDTQESKVLGDFDYSQLDPGIVGIVRVLRYLGFNTVDSGDGETKLVAGYDPAEIIPYPHVAIATSEDKLIPDARRLTRVLGKEWTIQATFDPRDDSSLILIMKLPKDVEEPT